MAEIENENEVEVEVEQGSEPDTESESAEAAVDTELVASIVAATIGAMQSQVSPEPAGEGASASPSPAKGQPAPVIKRQRPVVPQSDSPDLGGVAVTRSVNLNGKAYNPVTAYNVAKGLKVMSPDQRTALVAGTKLVM